MSRQTKPPPARCRAPQQIDLFAAEPLIREVPTWSRLPTEIQTALTELMIRLILDHADKNRIGSIAGAGHDL